MVKPIVTDAFFLRMPSADAVPEDLQTAEDLLDTLRANSSRCVGLAANMIGVSKRIIAVAYEGGYLVMLNPVIIKCGEPYQTEEACLSLTGARKTKRYSTIKVQYQTPAFTLRLKTFKGFPAQIIQHEIDHCNGILI